MTRSEIIEVIEQAGHQHKMIWIRAKEKDGPIEPRAVEPYSFRPKGTQDKFFFWCSLHNGTRNFLIDNIDEVKILEDDFAPRFPVEF